MILIFFPQEDWEVQDFDEASALEPMPGGGGKKFEIQAPLTGPNGKTWNITSVWGVDPDGTVRLITATP